ncbi:MAG: spore coat protein [Desulfotomaculum sp.]|nr:spore coat protein [Desulfotomaculum sp.]
MLCLEIESHSFYNRMAAQATDPSTRQLFKQLRDSKMRSITLLQEELERQKKK